MVHEHLCVLPKLDPWHRLVICLVVKKCVCAGCGRASPPVTESIVAVSGQACPSGAVSLLSAEDGSGVAGVYMGLHQTSSTQNRRTGEALSCVPCGVEAGWSDSAAVLTSLSTCLEDRPGWDSRPSRT